MLDESELRTAQTTMLHGLFVATSTFAAAISAQTAEQLCVFTGPGDTRASGQSALALYGTDLGITHSRC